MMTSLYWWPRWLRIKKNSERNGEQPSERERETQHSFMNGFPSFDLMVMDLVDRSPFPFLHLLIVLLFISLQIPTVRNLLSFSDFKESGVLIQNFAAKSHSRRTSSEKSLNRCWKYSKIRWFILAEKNVVFNQDLGWESFLNEKNSVSLSSEFKSFLRNKVSFLSMKFVWRNHERNPDRWIMFYNSRCENWIHFGT